MKKQISNETARRRAVRGDVFLGLPNENDVMKAIWHWVHTGEKLEKLPYHYKIMTDKDLDIYKY